MEEEERDAIYVIRKRRMKEREKQRKKTKRSEFNMPIIRLRKINNNRQSDKGNKSMDKELDIDLESISESSLVNEEEKNP